MADKLLIEIYLPASGQVYEMRIPRQLKVAQVTDMVTEYLKSKDDGEYVPTKEAVLCDRNTGKTYDTNAFIDRLGLENGTRLMLI